MSNKIYVLDWYINKYFLITKAPSDVMTEIGAGSKIVFEYEEKGRKRLSVGIYLGFDVSTNLEGEYVRPLEYKEKEYFEEEQEKMIKEYYPIFKKDFKESFAGSIPVTARYQIFTRQMYFYFHSEERYQFGNFVPNFQQKVGSAVFFFQIGARDMMRLTHEADRLLDMDGRVPHCRTLRPFPSIGIEEILLQQLEGRDIEKLKGRCGKLKCSLIYEIETYIQEIKKFPARGQKVTISQSDVSGFITGFNINTGEVSIKTDDKSRYRLDLSEIIRDKDEKKQIEMRKAQTFDKSRTTRNSKSKHKKIDET